MSLSAKQENNYGSIINELDNRFIEKKKKILMDIDNNKQVLFCFVFQARQAFVGPQFGIFCSMSMKLATLSQLCAFGFMCCQRCVLFFQTTCFFANKEIINLLKPLLILVFSFKAIL